MVTSWKFSIFGSWSNGKCPFWLRGKVGGDGIHEVVVPLKDDHGKDLPDDLKQEDVVSSIVGEFSDHIMSMRRRLMDTLGGIDTTSFPEVDIALKLGLVKNVLVRLKVERTVTTEMAGSERPPEASAIGRDEEA
jgi:hypothetical protein